MTIGLSYNDDISRIQVSVTGLPFSTGTIRIERSTNQLYWQTVRGAAELAVTGNAASVDDYEFTADVENHYRVVPIDPPAGLRLTGDSSANASTPDDSSLDVGHELDVRIDLALDDWTTSSNRYQVSKYDQTLDERAYTLRIGSGADTVQGLISGNGTGFDTADSSSTVPAANGERIAQRMTVSVDNVTGDWTAAFSSAPDLSSVFSPFGDTPTGTLPTTSLFDSSAPLVVGTDSSGGNPAGPGIVYAAQIRDAGVVVADPDFTGQAMSATSFTDSTGKLWTVNGTAYIVGTETNSITPSLGGFAWFKSIKHPFLNRRIHRVLAGGGQEIGRAARDGVLQVQGRSVPIVVSDVRSSRGFNLTLQVADETAARDMDLILASGDVFFIQVPPELTPNMSGGYVRIGDTVQHRVADTIKWRFELPCTVVAQPGPGVVGGTMTYGALLNLYGGYQNLLAANSTYADVLALMASPEDLVVL